MHLWIVNHYAYAPSHSSGTRHYSLARGLQPLGHQVTIVSASFLHKTHQETRLQPGEEFRDEIVDGVRFHWMRTPPYQGNTPARCWNLLAFAGRVWRERGLSDGPPPDA